MNITPHFVMDLPKCAYIPTAYLIFIIDNFGH